ncbi:MAG: hypothetical protein II128_02925 [Atopobiaceae bacterium]|jgi:hypothetical protein|nr:hypothetical protein [Atopobiaceae bacterium]
MLTAIVLAFFVLPVVAGVMKLAMRLLGWTLQLVVGIVLLPVWIVVALVGGLAAASQLLLPLFLVFLAISVFLPED